MTIFSLQCSFAISLALCCGRISFSLEFTSDLTSKTIKLLIYQNKETPCIHNIEVYKNAIFNTDSFTQVYFLKFKEMEESYCTNYCIKTASCDAIFVAKSEEEKDEYKNKTYGYWYDFDWCEVYKINTREVHVIHLTPNTSVPVVNTWSNGMVPTESELILIDFDVCCPNKCPNGTTCTASQDGSFQCISGFATLNWTGPEAMVYLPFEDFVPDEVVGNFRLADGRDQRSLWLDGNTTIDINMDGNTGCWRQVSTCKTLGFSLAFWIKVISNNGFELHDEGVGVISAMRQLIKEGWLVNLYNWNQHYRLKFRVNDLQIPGKTTKKLIDGNVALHQWTHYMVVYKYTSPNDNPNVLFQFYINGLPHDGGNAFYQSKTISSDIVNKLVFGRKTLNHNTGPYSNIILDEVLIFNGSVDATLALTLYQHYRP